MVGGKTLQGVNKKLARAKMKIAVVPLDKCVLLEKNARFMEAGQFQSLVRNIERDGCLTSVPFGVKEGDRYRILSGNHRVQAAREAGLTEIPLLYTSEKLSRQQAVAIQLSHNAIAGMDDLAVLRELYEEIEAVDWQAYSGLDDATMGRLDPPELSPLSEAQLEYRIVSIAFLPGEVKRAEALFQRVIEEAQGDTTWVNRRREYDRMLDVLAVAKAKANVKNTATAFGILLDIVEAHLADIPEAKKKSKPKSK